MVRTGGNAAEARLATPVHRTAGNTLLIKRLRLKRDLLIRVRGAAVTPFAHTSSFRISFPPTSVRRKSRPWKRKVSFSWSIPSRCRMVAWTSCTSILSPVEKKPSSSVVPMVWPGLVPPPANHMV